MNKSLWVEASLRAGELDRLEFMPRLWRKGMVITMKKTVSLITALALFILPLIGIVSASGGTPKVILDARESVVRVVTIWGDSYGHGTGFIIAHHGGKTYIATNRHVIVDNRDEVGDVKIVLTTAQGVLTDARVRFVGDRDDPTMDVVVLEVSDGSLNGRPTLPIISSDKVSAGDVIYTVGFPAGGDRFAEGVYPSRPEDMTILSGLISNTNSVHAGRAYVQHSADTHGGNSGGPLLNVKGEVVGIHTLSDVDAVDSRTTIKAALHTSYLISYCERNNIPIKIGANSFFNTTTIIMIAAGVVVIIVVAFALGKKRPAATAASAAPANPVNPGAPAAFPAQNYTAPAPMAAASRIRGVGGELSGRVFDVVGVLYIGRDPKRCQVVFQPQTPGVSGLHCEIRVDGSGMTITDKGSSNGTFVNDSRIGANIPMSLRSGDSFYLGSSSNSFTVM